MGTTHDDGGQLLGRAHVLQRKFLIIAVLAAAFFFGYILILPSFSLVGFSPIQSVLAIIISFNLLAIVCLWLSSKFDRSVQESEQ